ncbi:MAG: multifunctional oxoglutarate decarboxylase/oxoglutarate dehydrogenase thiamine pyrophosphate-binding subunit/dihydrolipoyllysine-residue succinyltransferase subunit, partial [Acidimicrobiales bacterium]|nr:multifunctional oxoglutarate decarboxylase/oxoglutarate dehydrogenase thiamine pyrophosphate-binding subunit/dihydrolipoyllysine-residue succinyltransferase subunit [Acidimicrobiales bacterium]
MGKLDYVTIPPTDNESNSNSLSQGFSGAFGPNAWLIDEMFDKFRSDPASVSSSWQEFFKDYRHIPGSPTRVKDLVENASVQRVVEARPLDSVAVSKPSVEGAVPLRGAAGKIVENMAHSLDIPTATSVRDIPAKLLILNRALLNERLTRKSGPKVSFTHIIAFAFMRALNQTSAMKNVFVKDCDGKGTPGVLKDSSVGLGVAVDTKKADGSRTLLVPSIKGANNLSFSDFVAVFEDILRRVKTNKLTVDDFADTTVSITNPGTIGTSHSIPRLMPGQGVILGVGAMANPTSLKGASELSLVDMAVSPVITLTSTYDHRVIQGAESGEMLAVIEALLMGGYEFYEEIFESMDISLKPHKWSNDVSLPLENAQATRQIRMNSYLRNIRHLGHLYADLDPLGLSPTKEVSELDLEGNGLSIWDLDRAVIEVDGKDPIKSIKFGSLVEKLRQRYMGSFTVEYGHIENPEERSWVQESVESLDEFFTSLEKRRILDRLNAADAFEQFLQSRYIGQKRFGLEGAESAICIIDSICELAASQSVSEVILGMAHRGRLNVLANVIGKSYENIFREFEGEVDPESVQGSGDVKYHKGATGTYTNFKNESVKVSMASNPSHLDAVDPVVEGIARAKLDLADFESSDPSANKVLPLLVHGDAAFAGQGIIYETLSFSQLPAYFTGGTIHLIINNQVGFTTDPKYARSSTYPSDVAKTTQSPIFHVNGDDPEACVMAARLAFLFRQKFSKDVVIDMVCYRLHGHNEGDDPSYTQPIMYRVINEMRNVRKLYTELLVRKGDISIDQAEAALDDFHSKLQKALDETRQSAPSKPTNIPMPPPVEDPEEINTAIDVSAFTDLVDLIEKVPDGFTIHPKLEKQIEARKSLLDDGELDWAAGESLGFASLVKEGISVRICGQDSRRGTFSHRHAAWIDYENGNSFYPISYMRKEYLRRGAKPGKYRIYDSLLSEYGALGFEYGYTIGSPEAMVVWEAQFGDFANGAQIIIDNFLVSASDKWGQDSGLTLFLPHGYEGQGPEHSSARIERFLTLAAGGNMIVAQPTTASQMFHLIRGQAVARPRRPLVVATPKSLLRAKQSRSKVEEIIKGNFKPVIDESQLGSETVSNNFENVQRVILCSGKVAYDAMAERDRRQNGATLDLPSVVVRVERLYPWPRVQIKEVFGKYANLKEIVWLQDEPDNMGPWPFVAIRIQDLV